ncbi:MAG: hypothetical protein JRH01_02705 [Deltaproteobacteria bacterium]|nr:hypothetical protein [Deltaproteobacteria bacterium]MBW2394390.1 hypothetical protein [Deltaproteobacteria bacterium]
MPASHLRERLAAKGVALAQREEEHKGGLDEARKRADVLRTRVDEGLEGYAQAIVGAPHLQVTLGPVHPDEKHVRAVEFQVARGRFRGLFIVKAKGELTLVGPFRSGRTEGPCQSFPWDANTEIDEAVAVFLESFLEEATAP